MMYPPNCPAPVRRAVMVQQWLELSFLHWPVDQRALGASLPEGLEPDLFDGSAWLGLVPFSMRNIRLPWSPPLPWLSSFPETNIRTYVIGPQGPGIYFYSLDINRLLPALVARWTYRLPYMWAKMQIDREPGRVSYEGARRWPGPTGAGSRVVVEIGEAIPPEAVSEQEHFFTARWGLYSQLSRGLSYAPVDHEPWPLQRATATAVREDLIAAAGFIRPDVAPIVHYSPGVTVRIGVPTLVGRKSSRVERQPPT
ncbi:MAG: DUF2071 domain-containing protein [Acidimicrobiia bacterium]|nr:DUF2071 domain-containing protein [Acidimicrobiia bacterium]